MERACSRPLKIATLGIATVFFIGHEVLRHFSPSDQISSAELSVEGLPILITIEESANDSTAVGSPMLPKEQTDHFQVVRKLDYDSLPPLLPEYRNPCWFEPWPTHHENQDIDFYECINNDDYMKNFHKATLAQMTKTLNQRMERETDCFTGEPGRLRCFPDFYLLGVTKCGTTELFRILSKYGNNFAPPVMKEPHFWGRRRWLKETPSCDAERYNTFASYIDIFDSAAEIIRSTTQDDDNGNPHHAFITGDFSPTTLNMNADWNKWPGNEGLEEPAITTAHYIRHLRPGTRFIVIMRDPVERFYSNVCMNLRNGKDEAKQTESSASTNAFRQAAKESLSLFHDCVAQHSLRACCYKDEPGTSYRLLTRGLYHVYIRDWLDVFPRDQFLFLTNEDLRSHRLSTIKQLVAFLGLGELSRVQVATIRGEQRAIDAEEKNAIPYPPIDKSAAKMLRTFYRPNIEELVHLVKNDTFNWTTNWH